MRRGGMAVVDGNDSSVSVASDVSEAPENLFRHVEESLFNGISENKLLKIAHSDDPDTFWIAKINLVCGHLLRVNYIGDKEEFWCDITKTKVHSVGWSTDSNDFHLSPPKHIKCDSDDEDDKELLDSLKNAMNNVPSISEDAIEGKGLAAIDRIKPGMKVEVENGENPFHFWIATVILNKGGRLLLSYDRLSAENNFWIFFTDTRIRKLGFVAEKSHPYKLVPPVEKCPDSLELLNYEHYSSEKYPYALLPRNNNLQKHKFTEGMKLEAINPENKKDICLATVVKVFNDYKFLIEIDCPNESPAKITRLCSNSYPYIFPFNWSKKHNIDIVCPKVWDKLKSFDWDQYLSMTNSVAAPAEQFFTPPSASAVGFMIGMKLEVVDPFEDSKFRVGHIVKIAHHLLLIKIDHSNDSYWYSHDSTDIFPIGWCDSNNIEITETRAEDDDIKNGIENTNVPLEIDGEKCICIYFNYKCYSGPFLSKNKLSQLPKYVGPGPLKLVLREVLNKIISVAYKPGKLLKDWEYEGKLTEDIKVEELKAKLKTSTHLANVRVVDKLEEISDFCKEMCSKLQACPFLFGLVEVLEQCPEKCSVANKAKFQSALSNDVHSKVKGKFIKSLNTGKKKRKRMHFMTIRARERRAAMEANGDKDGAESANESEPSPSSTPHQSESGTRPNSPDSNSDLANKKVTRKRVTRSNIPPLEMKTRGAKLPNFALQMKEGHWNKKDVQTMYSNTCVIPRKQYSDDSDSDNNCTSSNSLDMKNEKISDVSDSEEPELKKLRVTPQTSETPQHHLVENKNYTYSETSDSNLSFQNGGSPLPSDPSRWSIDELYSYLVKFDNFEDIAKKLYNEEVDGTAFLMLNLPTILEYLKIDREVALRLCKYICSLKWAYSQKNGSKA